MSSDVDPKSTEISTQHSSSVDSLESLLDFPGLNSFNFSEFSNFAGSDFDLPTSVQLELDSTPEPSQHGNLQVDPVRKRKSKRQASSDSTLKPSSVDVLIAKIQAAQPANVVIPAGGRRYSQEKARHDSLLLAKAKEAVMETVNSGLPSDRGTSQISEFPPAIHQLFEAALIQEELKKAEGYTQPVKQATKVHRNFVCAVPGCKKSFPQNAHLEIHMRSHTGDRPFKCDYPGCTKSFAQKGNLATHQRKHTGNKPFLCSYDDCGKSFTQLSNLKTHKRTHDVDRPFVCILENCKQSFAQLGNLKRHQNRHHKKALEEYIQKFSNINPTSLKNPKDIEIFDYFAQLYKNSNKGIKGRGKEPGYVPKPRKRRPRKRARNSEPEETQLPVLPFEFTLPEEFQVSPNNDRNLEMQLTGALGFSA